MAEIVWLIVIGTSIWVGFDSHQNKITSSGGDYSLWNGAIGWVIVCLLLWIIAFPAYLVRRSRLMGERSRATAVPVVVTAGPSLQKAPAMGVADELAKLANLKAQGHISEGDFERAKSRLLS